MIDAQNLIKTQDMGWSYLAFCLINLRPNVLDDKEWLENMEILANRYNWGNPRKYRHDKEPPIWKLSDKVFLDDPVFMSDAKTMKRKELSDKYHMSFSRIIRILGRADTKLTTQAQLKHNEEFLKDCEIMSGKELAAKWHITRNTIDTWRYNDEIPKKNYNLLYGDIVNYRKTHTLKDTAKHFNIHPSSVAYMCKRYGNEKSC